jgi:hypothetical protein
MRVFDRNFQAGCEDVLLKLKHGGFGVQVSGVSEPQILKSACAAVAATVGRGPETSYETS